MEDYESMDSRRPIVGDLQRASLTRTARIEEVKKAVFGMKKFGSPGSDGIQAIFYQKYWDVVGPSLTNLVNEAIRSGRIPCPLLTTFITLIPKKERPGNASDFRPITLLNMAFKIISKVIVNIMRPIMKNIIGPHQNSFLPRRSTLDNIFLTQEVVHSMNQKKGKKGTMVVKIDLCKAYDTLDWGFLESVMRDFGFPATLINMIMFAVRESSISILWNGEKLPPSRQVAGLGKGIRLPRIFLS